MSFVTLNVKELRERWKKLYVNIHMLRSKNPMTMAILEPFKRRSSEFNEEAMSFFEKIVEAEG